MNTLVNAKINDKLKVVKIVGGRGIQCRLAQLGIGIGSIIIVCRNAPFSGPLIIEHDGSKFAIGMGIAARIIVKAIS